MEDNALIRMRPAGVPQRDAPQDPEE